MDRSEALSLLKELVSNNLVQLSLISIEKNQKGTFSLILEANCALEEIKKYVADKNITVEENEEGYCILSKD